MQVTYFVVMSFYYDRSETLVAGDPQSVDNAVAAWRFAQALACVPGKAGAIAFSRTGDRETGEFQAPHVIAEFGEVDRRALQD